MSEWPRIEFAELLTTPIRSGVNAPSRTRGAGVRLINMGELFSYDRIGDIKMERAPIPGDNEDRYLVAEGDLLFARQSLSLEGAGKCSIVVRLVEPTSWEGHILRARLDPLRAAPAFFYYYFRSRLGRQLMSTIVEQVAAAGIRGSDLARLKVPHPPLDVQRAIAEVLGALDDKIESNWRMAFTTEALLDALAAEIADLPGSPLSDVTSVVRVPVDPGALGTQLVDHFSLPAFDAARLPDVVAGEAIRSGKLLIPAPSILVSRLNPGTDRTWLAVPRQGVVSAASTEFLVLEPTGETSLGAIWLAVRDGLFRSELARRASGTSGSHQRVRPADALAIEVPDIRRAPGRLIEEAEELLRLVHNSRTESVTLADLRDALLPELLAGRLRVPEAERVVEAAT